MKHIAILMSMLAISWASAAQSTLTPIKYNNPGLVVDLGVGLWAWPLPMDFDGDGDYDLVVTCPDKPTAATVFFENVEGDVKFPVFKPGKKISKALQNAQVSFVNGKPHVLTPGLEHAEFLTKGLDVSHPLPLDAKLNLTGKLRANQWKWADYDGDGIYDLLIGIGEWTEYGWDNAYDANGNWTNGPLRGWVYFARNTGTIDAPVFAEPVKLEADGKPVDGYGMPSQNLEDFDNDGDLDLICGEFLDGFTWFENVGTRTEPKLAAGRQLTRGGEPIKMDLQMIVPVAIDWDKDGDQDLVVGDEDGRVALVEHTGEVVEHMPQFKAPVYFQQQAEYVKCGALVSPVSFDWDGDGDEDLVCGNTAGYVEVVENLGGAPPKWDAPKKLEADGKVIRIQAGPNGSIQGPAEAKWGYTTLSVADWDHDGLPDVVVNSIWGKVIWYRNEGTRSAPKLAASKPVEVEWKSTPPKPAWIWWNPTGNELATQWRTTPVVVDYDADGLNDLVMLDHEGYLAFFKRTRGADATLRLQPGERIFVDEAGAPLLLAKGIAGKSGRRKLRLVDWDGDKRFDILINSTNCDWFKNLCDENGKVVFKEMGALSDVVLAGHDTSPTTSDWNKDGVSELLLGAEDGLIYRLDRTK
ncbi:MAG: VCBS repeat-containing protein [Candidatus Hydrogenedentes bacterium]|nr:VCBS repeat-containing protein [Candidatus Hydrogenedentota bacterium]